MSGTRWVSFPASNKTTGKARRERWSGRALDDCQPMPSPENKKTIHLRNRKNHPSALFLGIAVSALLFLLNIFHPGLTDFLHNRTYDFLVKMARPAEPSPVPVIVDIDEKSLREYGQWPWSRHRIATLIDQLGELGALAIGLDILFAEEDRTSMHVITRELRRDFGLDLQVRGVPPGLMNNDQILAEALSRNAAVLGYQFLFEEDSRPDGCLLHPLRIHRIGRAGEEEAESLFLRARGVACNLDSLSRAAWGSGFFNIAPDPDGIMRRMPLIIEHQGRLYPSLALATLMRALAVSEAVLKTGRNGEDSLILDKTAIPLTANGAMLIRFRGKGKTFEYVSAADILSKRVPKNKIQGKILLVGTSASGMKELKATALDPIYPGVEIHATIVDNILKKDFLLRPKWASGLESILALGFGLLSTLILTRTGAGRSSMVIGALAVGASLVSLLTFIGGGIFLSPVSSLLVLGATFSSLSLLKYWDEEQIAKERARELVMVQEATIESMSSLVETRDPETGGHIKRTQNYIRLLAETLKKCPRFRTLLDDESIDLLCKSAPLHDIGKVGVSDRILLKPGRLTDQEFEEMKKHTVYGRDALFSAEKKLETISFLRCAREIAYTHHEKWNGSGYPEGLRGEEIPLSGRLMALADSYDAITSNRVYKAPVPHEKAVQIITEEKGSQFDPEIVDAFLKAEENFRQIALKYADS
jgi:CHASE2 domain-containing sensor protein